MIDPAALPTVLILLTGVLATEPWRWAGFGLARRIDVDSMAFRLARAVSNAIVAAFVTRLLLEPPGALADVPVLLRGIAFAAAIAGFLWYRQQLWFGVLSGVLVISLGLLLL